MSGIREEFEAWYIREFFDGDKECAAAWMITDPVSGGYLMDRPAQYLKVWQASRAALKVELPAGKPWFAAVTEEEELRKHRGYGWNDCLDAVGEALQQAGIEVVK